MKKKDNQTPLPLLGPISYYIPSKNGVISLSGLAKELKPVMDAELRVMRGDYSGIREFYDSADKGGQTFLTVAHGATLGAIGLGDTKFLDRILADLAAFPRRNGSSYAGLGVEITLTSIRLLLRAKVDCPKWMTDLEIEIVPRSWRRQVAYLLVKVFQMRGERLAAAAMSGVLLNLCEDDARQSAGDIYLKLMRGMLCRDEGHVEMSERWFRQVVAATRPLGIILPFLGVAMGPKSAVERALQELAPEMLLRIKALTKPYFRNLVHLHNHYTGERITDQLSPREFYMARLLKSRRSYKEIAACMGLAPGRVNAIVSCIYEKLGVHGRNELSGLLW